MLFRVSGCALNAKSIERLCHYYGQALEEIDDKSEPEVVKASAAESVYVMVDGTMVFTREEGWKEMKLGRIFKASDRICATRRITLRESTYVARLGPHTEFLAELEKRLIDLPQKIIIADGATWIWNYFEAFHPTAIQILDFYHAVEKLSSFARVLFRNERRRKQWTVRQIQLLRADGVESVIAEVESLSCRGRAKQAQERLINYYRRNKKRMLYGTYESLGYLIGSGAIESAHRNVLHKRLKLSGQRWTKKGLQQVANLRVAYTNQQWNKVEKLIKNAA